MRAKGKVLAPAERPSGKIEFDLDAVRAGGLAEIATRAVGSDAGALVRRLLVFGAPLKLTGTVAGAGAAAGVEIAAKGKLSGIDANVDATFDLLSETLSDASVTLEARDFGRIVSLLGFTPGPPSPGDGTLEVNLAKANAGTIPVSARLTVPGATISAEGDVRQNAEGRIEPKFAVRVDGSDLRPLLAAAARAGGEAAVPAEGTALLTRTKDAFALQNIAMNLAGARVRGSVTATRLERPELGGKLSIERMVLANLLGLVLGNAGDDKAFWPTRLTSAPLAGATGTLEFEVGALEVIDRLTALDAKFKLRLAPNEAALEEISANFAGGKFAGQARFLRGETLGFDGSGKLTSFEVARLLAPGTWRAAARGQGEMTLTLAGNGQAPAALVAGLAGQGTLRLEGLEIDRLDPDAVGAVFIATEAGSPPDEVGVVAALGPALAKGPLKIARVEMPLIVASGVMRTGKILASVGRTQISGLANFDIARLAVDGTVEIEAPAPAGLTARPGATVRWRGPIAGPERGIEAAALATAITLRAMERETKRIEERDRALPPLTPPRSTSPVPSANPVEASIAGPSLPPRVRARRVRPAGDFHARISTAVRQTSPSPCAKWASPVENSAPCLKTGRNSRAPFVNCFTSKFPPFSRGGMVRRPVRPQCPGIALAGSGGGASPPLRARALARAQSASFLADGATAEIPMNGAPEYEHRVSVRRSPRRHPCSSEQGTVRSSHPVGSLPREISP